MKKIGLTQTEYERGFIAGGRATFARTILESETLTFILLRADVDCQDAYLSLKAKEPAQLRSPRAKELPHTQQ
jgi:hypothetical protein